ncbi:hypothetical protein VMCG_06528 [Cytospora schulzeri]|uniref:Uncharacterized protein n=1 Tax=Cytospora schulzeri TaxID=448051 RepID=A0A423WBW9_9PEZI|nr:hypothetical protein VMCG_06528 [Valsa malicola]
MKLSLISLLTASAINRVLAGHCGSLPPGVQGPCWPTILEAPEFHLNIAQKDVDHWVDEAGKNLQNDPVGTVLNAVKDVGGAAGGTIPVISFTSNGHGSRYHGQSLDIT